jgi:hypothetical protein
MGLAALRRAIELHLGGLVRQPAGETECVRQAASGIDGHHDDALADAGCVHSDGGRGRGLADAAAAATDDHLGVGNDGRQRGHG